jgi:hypothetical protein
MLRMQRTSIANNFGKTNAPLIYVSNYWYWTPYTKILIQQL